MAQKTKIKEKQEQRNSNNAGQMSLYIKNRTKYITAKKQWPREDIYRDLQDLTLCCRNFNQ